MNSEGLIDVFYGDDIAIEPCFQFDNLSLPLSDNAAQMISKNQPSSTAAQENSEAAAELNTEAMEDGKTTQRMVENSKEMLTNGNAQC